MSSSYINFFSAKILKGIYEHLPISISRIDRKGNILDIRGSICNKSGDKSYPPSESGTLNSYKNFFDYFPNLKHKIENIFQTAEKSIFDSKVETEDGGYFYFNNYAFLMKNDLGEDEVIVISLDITKDTLAKESLSKKNLELKAIFDAIPDVYFRMDYEGLILDYKSASVSQLYIPEELFVGRPISSFLPGHLNTSINLAIQIVKDTNKLHTLEYSIPMGVAKRYFEARFLPINQNEIIVIVREITDRIIYQEKLRENEKMLLETQKIAKVFSFFWDLEENRVTWTDEFYNMIQKKPTEVENTPDGFLEFVHPDDRDHLIMEMQNTFKYKTDYYVEYRMLLPGNKIVHMLTEGKLKFDKFGNPIQMLGLNQDITQRKEYEIELVTQKRELERLLENIEGIVSHKTNEVVIEKEKAEKANQAKTMFLANISHELKTPIHAIMSFAELGYDKVDKLDMENIKEYFSIIHESGARLYNLMSDILDLSKMDSGKDTLSLQKANMVELTEKVIVEMNGVLNKKDIKIQLNNNLSDSVVEMDYSKITQVVRNLLSNAIKFSPDHSTINIDISSGDYIFPDQSVQETAVIWKVLDMGEGIDESEKDMIFENFKQGSKVKMGTSGTGLGLAISREIIQSHRGVIYGENNSKGGAEFVFLIPQCQ